MTTPANASEQYKDETASIASGWRVAQIEEVSVITPSITFTVPATAKMVRIQGVLEAPPGLTIYPAITFNGDATAIYNSVRIDTTATGDAAPTNVLAGNSFNFTSLYGNSEASLIDITVPVKTNISRQLIKATGFNNGGTEGDYHTCVGWAASALDVSTIELFTSSPFNNGIGIDSFFTFSVIK